jgi:hypothetical protein
MTYTELLDQMPSTLTIMSLGGRTSLTILNSKGGLVIVNSKGSTYPLSRQDWINAKRIRSSYPRNPWRTALYSETSSVFSYSLIYAAALLRHIEPGEEQAAPNRLLVRFHRKAQDQSAA